jgi:hypothetical protein
MSYNYQVIRDKVSVMTDVRAAYVPGHFCSSHGDRQAAIEAMKRYARAEPGVWFSVEKVGDRQDRRQTVCHVKAELSLVWKDGEMEERSEG